MCVCAFNINRELKITMYAFAEEYVTRDEISYMYAKTRVRTHRLINVVSRQACINTGVSLADPEALRRL